MGDMCNEFLVFLKWEFFKMGTVLKWQHIC